ncbi:MAG: hypothetical protein Q9182_004305 [Xanthomendoza sp. 2 TL-2023]
MEARKREVEESQLRKTQSTESGDSECEEVPTDRMAQTNHYLSAQEACGIYPTPPDGLTSHAASSVTAQDTPAASNLEVYPDLTTVNEIPEVHIPDVDSPQETISRGRFMKDEGQDLFGDMDTDMFDTNVLTEADFNFFDEPDDVEDPLEALPDDQTGLHPPTLEVGNTPRGDEPREATQLDVIELRVGAENDLENGHHEILSRKKSPLKQDINLPSSEGIATQKRADELKAVSSIERRNVSQASINKEKQSSFEVTAFEGRPLVHDAKYLQEGKYAASPPKAQTSQKPSQSSVAPSSKIPRIGPLLGIDELSSDETEDSETDHQSLTDGDKDELSTAISGLAKVGMGTERAIRSAKKRKRESSTDSECPATPAESVASTQANLEPSNDLSLYRNLEYSSRRALHDIIGFLEDQPADLHSNYHGTDQHFIQVAQLVTDQTILRTGVFQLPLELTGSAYELRPTDESKSPISLDHEIIAEICHDVKPCDLKRYHELDLSVASDLSQKTTSLQDDSERRRQAVLQSRDSKSQNEAIYETQTPYLHVQRGQDAVNIAPPSLYFWEELGLAPSQQRKDVMAFCIYPDHRILRDAASRFMTTMQSSYQNCKLGSHRDGIGVSRKYVEGLVPVPIARTDAGTFWDSLYKASDHLGSEIPMKGADGTNIVIYLVDPFNEEAKLPHLCTAFLKLFTTYATGAKQAGMASANDVVLQIVPLSFLASCDSLVMPPPKAYAKLAFEVYSRCSPAPSSDGTIPSPFTSGSAICLAKPVPKTVSFQLSIQPPIGLLLPDPTLHLAYSWITNQQWLTCAWTDNLGLTRWNATYCLGASRPDFWAAFAETVGEVLDTTKDLLQPASLLWRLYIVKDSDMHQQELDADPSARLIDVVSTTWAMVSPTPILDPFSGPLHLASVLASGYLFKRTGAEDYDGLIPLGINLIATVTSKPEVGSCQTNSKILREVLDMYSDLAMLARLRGLEEWKTGILPWHVAAARKARRVVTRCMRWGERKS